MADVLGFVSGAVGLVSLGLQVCSALRTQLVGSRDSSELMGDTLHHLKETSDSLEALLRVFASSDLAQKESVCVAPNSILLSAWGCSVQSLKKLQKSLDKSRLHGPYKFRRRIGLQPTELQGITIALKEVKRNLSFVLQVMQSQELDSLKGALSQSLERHPPTLASTLATDPRDRLYAFLALHSAGNKHLIVPDYNRTVEHLCQDVTRHIFEGVSSTSKLLAGTSVNDLPSWAPKVLIVVPNQPTWTVDAAGIQIESSDKDPNDDDTGWVSDAHSSDTDDDARSTMSEISVATSMTSIYHNLGEEVVQSFIDVLFCNDGLLILNMSAILDPVIGRDGFNRRLQQLIQSYGRDLLSEASTAEEKAAAYVLGSRLRAAWIASKVVDHASDRTLLLSKRSSASTVAGYSKSSDSDDYDIDDGASSSSSEGGDDVALASDFAAVKDFLLDSRAYLTFQTKLLDFAHRPYKERIAAVMEIDEQGHEVDRLSEKETRLLTELPYIPAEYIAISYTEHLSFADHLKGQVEDWMGETWDWWPVQPRRHSLQKDSGRICGVERYVDLLRSNVIELEEALKHAPLFLSPSRKLILDYETTSITQQPSVKPPATNTVLPVRDGSGHGTQPLQPTNSGQSNSPTQVSKDDRIAQGHHAFPNAQQASGKILESKHVFLAVKRGTDYRVADIDVSLLSDAQFFHRLKCTFLDLRGWWRNLFSWWRYNHCDFYRLRKYAPRSFTVCQRQFPRENNHEYEFSPRPMDPLPPIDDHEFRMRFYHSCETPHSWHRHQCNRFRTSDTQAIAVLPKRLHALELEGDKRDDFWGIYAIETRSFHRVLTYFILCNSPGIAFFFAWLFGLKRPTDLQDAIILLGVSLTLTAGFFKLLGESRDQNKK